MMANQSIFLTRKDFQSSASTTFTDLYESNEFTDVTLVSKDSLSISAHKIIISSSSSVLRQLIVNSETAFVDVKHAFLKLIVKFIYTGQCEVDQKYLVSFLAVAKNLKIKGLIPFDEEESPKENMVESYKETTKSSPKIGSDNDSENKIIHTVDDVINEALDQEEVDHTDISQGTDSKVSQNKYVAVECVSATAPVENIEQPFIQDDTENIGSIVIHSENPRLKQESKRKLRSNNISPQNAKYKCSECPYMATSKISIKYHVTTVHNGRIHYCKTDNCQLDYKDSENDEKVLLHYRLISCSICGVKFTKNEHTIHLKTHLIDGEYCCVMCDYKNKMRYNVRIHREVVHLKIDYICEICAFKAKHISELKRHKKKSHYLEFGIEEFKKAYCEICEKYVCDKFGLKKHIQTQHNENTEFHRCEKCQKTFKNENRLQRHSKYAHSTLKYDCTICGEQIAKLHFTSHRESHKLDGLFCCDLCEYKHKNSLYVKHHKNAVHKGVMYECKTDICQYKSKWSNDLKTHKENIHFKIRYSCNICDITTGTKGNLYQHQYKVHKIMNKIKCEICDKVFRKSSTLLAHKCYTEMQYKCDICDEEKKTSDMLAYHMATSHNMGSKALNKYHCPHCNYIRIEALTNTFARHLRTQHNMETKNIKRFLQKNTEEESVKKKIKYEKDEVHAETLVFAVTQSESTESDSPPDVNLATWQKQIFC